jgi:hypothetical protein
MSEKIFRDRIPYFVRFVDCSYSESASTKFCRYGFRAAVSSNDRLWIGGIVVEDEEGF